MQNAKLDESQAVTKIAGRNMTLSDIQAEFRKGRGTRDQIANICWILEKAREFQKNVCFIDYTETFDSGSQLTVKSS